MIKVKITYTVEDGAGGPTYTTPEANTDVLPQSYELLIIILSRKKAGDTLNCQTYWRSRWLDMVSGLARG